MTNHYMTEEEKTMVANAINALITEHGLSRLEATADVLRDFAGPDPDWNGAAIIHE